MDKDPWCCASDKMRISIDGFNAGCLSTYRSMRYVVRSLPCDQALQIIDNMIANLESGTV